MKITLSKVLSKHNHQDIEQHDSSNFIEHSLQNNLEDELINFNFMKIDNLICIQSICS